MTISPDYSEIESLILDYRSDEATIGEVISATRRGTNSYRAEKVRKNLEEDAYGEALNSVQDYFETKRVEPIMNKV